jgi:biopolymer transport protein ExbD
MDLQRIRKPKAEVFTGTMADVSFLLVIFFVVTFIFSATKGIEFHPDTSDTEVSAEPEHSVDILVRADGTLLVDQRTMRLPDLLAYIKSKLDQDPLKPVILRTEPDATYGHMMTVLDELHCAPEKMGFTIAHLAIPTLDEMESFLDSL